MVRTRFAPSPTGYMHIGNLRTALYEYLIAKSQGGQFVLRIEDTDQKRLVSGALELIYKTLEITGLKHDEGPDVGGSFGPYVQSQRRDIYMGYAKELVDKGCAYYCFCKADRMEKLHADSPQGITKYDRHCHRLSKEEIDDNLANGLPFVIRQLIPEGKSVFEDVVYGRITIDNSELDDQVLIKSDGLPTYNFANVVDDHLMEISHVVRGSEYVSSTPKYNLLYEAFGWERPVYAHLPLILNSKGEKISKRRGDASFEDLLSMGYLPKAILNYIALLGWSPGDNREILSLQEMVDAFEMKNLSKSPSSFDIVKLRWVNGMYIKNMEFDDFYTQIEPYLKDCVKSSAVDLRDLAMMAQSRINLFSECSELFDFIDALPQYSTDLYTHKKMKTDSKISLCALKAVSDVLSAASEPWENDSLYKALTVLASDMSLKNSQVLWPLRTALSGKPASPCGASELACLLGREESLKRIAYGIKLLEGV